MPIIRPTYRKISASEVTLARIREHQSRHGIGASKSGADEIRRAENAQSSVDEARELTKSVVGKYARAPENNPFHPLTYNVTRQMELIKANRRLARALAAIHGIAVAKNSST